MTAPTGQISLLDIQNEFGGSSPISLSEYYALAGYVPGGQNVPASGVISFNDLRGKTKVVDVTAPASTILYDVDLRTALIAAGWDQNAPAIYRVPSTTKIFSTSASGSALYVSGSYPGGLTIINNGKILGKGGNGGYNTGGFSSSGGVGGAGGPAIVVRSPCTIQNLGTIGGGGGGGGSAGSPSAQASYFVESGGGGGGAGGNSGAGGTSGGYRWGAAGNEETGGAAGYGYAGVFGGNGGDLGKDGLPGGTGENGGAGGGLGGRAGRAVYGSEYVTWLAYGTIKGGLTESTWSTMGGFVPNGVLAPDNASWGTWGPTGYGTSSYYLYQLIYSTPTWGNYPPADYHNDDYYGPLSWNTGNGMGFDWKLFGKSLKMQGSYSDGGALVSSNSYIGVWPQPYDLYKSNSVGWTMEAWVYPLENNNVTGYACILNLNNNSSYYGFRFYRKNVGSLYVQTGYGAWESAANKIPLNAWTHICVERKSNQTRVYINGVWQYTDPAPPSSALVVEGPDVVNSYKVGSLAQQYGYEFCGYISNVRIVANTVVYNAGSGNFSVPTSPLTAVTGTVFLACQSNSATKDNSVYNLPARATGAGTASGGYTRDFQIAGSIAPVASTVNPFGSGQSYSVYFKGPGTTTTTGYGILDFPGKPDRTLITNPVTNITNQFAPYQPAIDRIMICAQDLQTGFYRMESGISPNYGTTADFVTLSYNGVSSSFNAATLGWGSVRIMWRAHFFNPNLFGGKMAMSIHTAPIGAIGPYGSVGLTAWTGRGISGIGSSNGSEWLDFSDILNGPGQSVFLIGDSEGRNWKAYKGYMQWSHATNKSPINNNAYADYSK